ncbi:hypothetical protein NDU88_005386 [Pleurodeles waltl]|uniref:Uncharacterized protein n=1 Tax=Pleurodeles waltl TaxID=8319 RepID=A0AAV7LNZ1_PLEWA|nr:hypothetical protein NDU88_005386 [Pleurodeles waltl]
MLITGYAAVPHALKKLALHQQHLISESEKVVVRVLFFYAGKIITGIRHPGSSDLNCRRSDTRGARDLRPITRTLQELEPSDVVLRSRRGIGGQTPRSSRESEPRPPSLAVLFGSLREEREAKTRKSGRVQTVLLN